MLFIESIASDGVHRAFNIDETRAQHSLSPCLGINSTHKSLKLCVSVVQIMIIRRTVTFSPMSVKKCLFSA